MIDGDRDFNRVLAMEVDQLRPTLDQSPDTRSIAASSTSPRYSFAPRPSVALPKHPDQNVFTPGRPINARSSSPSVGSPKYSNYDLPSPGVPVYAHEDPPSVGGPRYSHYDPPSAGPATYAYYDPPSVEERAFDLRSPLTTLPNKPDIPPLCLGNFDFSSIAFTYSRFLDAQPGPPSYLFDNDFE